jgi:hypothetical protein
VFYTYIVTVPPERFSHRPFNTGLDMRFYYQLTIYLFLPVCLF